MLLLNSRLLRLAEFHVSPGDQEESLGKQTDVLRGKAEYAENGMRLAKETRASPDRFAETSRRQDAMHKLIATVQFLLAKRCPSAKHKQPCNARD